jgi:hypothetical protein
VPGHEGVINLPIFVKAGGHRRQYALPIHGASPLSML